MRITIRLVDRLLEKVKKYALSHGTTFTAIIEDAIRKKIMELSPTKKQSTIKLRTVNGKGAHAGIDLDDSSSLLDVMES